MSMTPAELRAAGYPENYLTMTAEERSAFYAERNARTGYEAKPIKPSRPRRERRAVVYTRAQEGHSLTKWLIASCCLGFPIIGVVYYTVSPNHFWRA